MRRSKVPKRPYDIDLISIILIVALGIIVYGNSFFCTFHFDDVVFIINNYSIRDISNLQNIWNWWPCRFITFLSFALNYQLNQLNVFGYHLFNLIIHLFCSILVWWFVRLTFSTPLMKDKAVTQHTDLISLFSALIFVSHPIQTQAVTFVWQRAASLAALFYLASLCFYVYSRLLEDKASASNQVRIYYLFSLTAAILAMFTKEISITLPLMLLLYDYSFFKTERNFKWKCLIPFLFTFIIIPVIWLFSGPEKIQASHSFVSTISPLQYLLTEFRVILTYIRLIFLPLHQNLDYDFVLSKNIFEAPVILSFIFLIIIFSFAVSMFSKYRLVSFAIFWFFLTLLPESSFFPFADVIEEHRLYLPLVGYCVFIVSGLYYILGKRSIKVMVAVLGVVVISNSILTFDRNKVWKDNIALWSDTIQKSPHKARPYNDLGFEYLNQGDLVQALVNLNKAIEIDPRFTDAYYNLGILYDKQGNIFQALYNYGMVFKLDPNYMRAYYNRGTIYAREGNLTRALSDFNKAIKLDPGYAQAYNNRGIIYVQQGDWAHAVSDYNKAIEIIPDDAEAYNNLGIVYNSQGEYTQAMLNYDKAIELKPDYAEAYNNRGLASAKQGKLTEAMSDFDKAIEINPDYAQVYYNRAVSYYQLEEYDKAWENVHKATDLGLAINLNFVNALKQASGQ